MSVDRSYGMIPFRVHNGEIEFLLVRQTQGRHWSFPKGHAKFGEEPLAAAFRELREETGLTPPREHLVDYPPLLQRFGFYRSQRLRRRELVLYIVYIYGNPTIVLKKDEVDAYQWMTREQIKKIGRFRELIANALDAYDIIMELIPS